MNGAYTMSFLDKFLNAVRLNDDYDDDEQFFDEEEYDEEDEPVVEEAPLPEEPAEKPKSRFFRKMNDQDEDLLADAGRTPARTEARTVRTSRNTSAASSKVTPMRKQAAARGDMEVSVIRPTSMENTREIADTLLSNCTVVLNLEGIDVELAQRIIDFACGTCYAIDGSLQKVSSYIFILTPANVEISGDIQDILNGGIPSIRSGF